MKDTSLYRRGQVWFINDNVESKGSIQCKSRPYLVISNDRCNAYSTVIHMAPITSKVKGDYPTHVLYKDMDEIPHTILIEQITPKSVPHIKRNSRYMYTLSDDVIGKVDEAILRQFGILSRRKKYDEYLDSTIDSSISLIESAASLEESEGDESRSSQIDKFNSRMSKYKELNNIEEKLTLDRSPQGRIRWTIELKKRFIEDATKHCAETMMKRYGMTKSTYRTNLSKFKKELSEKKGL